MIGTDLPPPPKTRRLSAALDKTCPADGRIPAVTPPWKPLPHPSPTRRREERSLPAAQSARSLNSIQRQEPSGAAFTGEWRGISDRPETTAHGRLFRHFASIQPRHFIDVAKVSGSSGQLDSGGLLVCRRSLYKIRGKDESWRRRRRQRSRRERRQEKKEEKKKKSVRAEKLKDPE